MMECKGKILIVDDNEDVLLSLNMLLKPWVEAVRVLRSPERVPEFVENFKPDVILLDMNFAPGTNSGRDGLLWLENIHRRHPDVPVVLVTAYAEISLAVNGLKSGASDFVTKPWDNTELVRVLKDAVDKSRKIVPLEQVEAEHVRRVVEKCHGNMSKSAELLGITRQTLYAKMKR